MLYTVEMYTNNFTNEQTIQQQIQLLLTGRAQHLLTVLHVQNVGYIKLLM